MRRLERKRALVTGGARGIGAAIARAYAAEGAAVCVADLRVEQAARVAGEIGGGAFGIALDVAKQESVDAAIETMRARLGGIDILVNNAGVFDLAPIVEVTRDSYERVFAVNVAGLLFMMQAAARAMIAQGAGGKIVNLSSQAGRRGEPLVAVYCASKAAVVSLTQSAGLDLIRHGINVNGIAPGVVESDMWDQVDALFAKYEGLAIGEKKRRVGAAVPAGRMGVPEDIAGAAVFLASSDADYVVAQTWGVDGGNWMS